MLEIGVDTRLHVFVAYIILNLRQFNTFIFAELDHGIERHRYRERKFRAVGGLIEVHFGLTEHIKLGMCRKLLVISVVYALVHRFVKKHVRSVVQFYHATGRFARSEAGDLILALCAVVRLVYSGFPIRVLDGYLEYRFEFFLFKR